MSTIVRVGSHPLIAQLFTFTFEYSTVAGEEPSVGDVVILKSDGKVKKSDADFSLAALGVVLSKNTSAGICTVCMHGIVAVTAAAAINRGAVVGSAANGRVKAIPAAGATYAASDVENAKAKIGKALTSAAAAGDTVVIALEVA